MTIVRQALREAILPRELVDRLVRAAGDRLILVGGQALAFWAHHYGVDPPPTLAYISRDIDFLAESAGDVSEVRRLATILGGRAVIPHEKALTALVGQAIKEVADHEYFTVDVIHKVLGGRRGLRERAVDVELDGAVLKVMHPIDVIGSRLVNLHRLPEKQNELGDAQMRIAIGIGQRMTRGQRDEGVLLQTIEVFATMALSDAGRKVGQRRGLHVADAIDPANVLHVPAFRGRRLPQIMALMSREWRVRVQAQLDATGAGPARRTRHAPGG
jgi:hypothetical protein